MEHGRGAGLEGLRRTFAKWLQARVEVLPRSAEVPDLRCQRVLESGTPLIADDPPFAGAPIVHDGVLVGMVFATAAAPRRFTADDLAALGELAQAASTELELEAVRAELAQTERARMAAQQELAQRILQQSAPPNARELRLTNFLESIIDAFVLLDRDWRYVYVNQRAGQIFKRRPEDLVGKHIWTEFPEGIGQKFYHAYYRAEAEQQPLQIEEYYPPYDRWFENRIFPSKEGLAIFFQDVTERKRAETERSRVIELEHRARAELETIGKLKDEFLATISHELRTPLTAVLGWTELLQTRKLDAQTSERALDTIMRNARTQARLIEDLLDISRIISRKLMLKTHDLPVAPVLEAAIDSLRPAATAKSIRIESDLDGEPVIAGDRDRLQQIFWNLLSNAVRFTAPGGLVRIRLWHEGRRVVVEISDNGQGIAPEFLPFVFDRFRQGDSSSTRQHGGLGLGLAIVRHLVELHGGIVHAASAGEGLGATFRVELPAKAAHPSREVGPALQPRAPVEPLPDLRGVRVLVVDDERDSLDVVEAALERCGAQVTLAESTEAGIAALRARQPHVVLADIGMPGDDGYAFIARIRQLSADEGGQVKAIAVTAYARDEDRARALAAGYQMHLTKPFAIGDLLSAVASAVERPPRPPT